MNYWLAISNKENSDVVIRESVWGVSRKHVNTIGKTQPGDLLLIYCGQKVIDKDHVFPTSITACFQITSKVFESSSKIFLKPKDSPDEVFPLRIKLKSEKIFDPPIEFKPLIPKLHFITNKTMWTGHIRGKAMREIPEEDYLTIMTAEKKR